MKALIWVLLPPITGIVGLAAFTTWYTALLFLGLVGGFTVGVVHYVEKHQRENYETKPARWKTVDEYLKEVKKD